MASFFPLYGVVLVFAVIYSVASFLGLTFITKAQDHAVVHAMKKVNAAINSIVPKEGVQIATSGEKETELFLTRHGEFHELHNIFHYLVPGTFHVLDEDFSSLII